MSVLEHFKSQPPHTRDGVERWFVIADKNGTPEVSSIPTTEMEIFVEGLVFEHLAGLIPRFSKPQTKGKWRNPLNRPDGNR